MIESYVITGIIHMEDKLIVRITFLDEKGDKIFKDSIELPKDRYAKDGGIDVDKLEEDLSKLIELKAKSAEERVNRSMLRLIGRRRKLRKRAVEAVEQEPEEVVEERPSTSST